MKLAIILFFILSTITQGSLEANIIKTNHKLKKECHYNASGKLIYYFINNYNNKGQLRQQKRYDNGVLKLYQKYKYNSQGQLKKTSYFNSKKELIY